MPYYRVLASPDSAPFYPVGHHAGTIEAILKAGSAWTPHDFLWLALPPLVHHDISYLIDTLLIAAGGALLLNGRGVPRLSAWFGGGVLAMAGYSFTLVAAGHRGLFHMGVYVAFMLAFVLRAVKGGNLWSFALAGACAGWAIKYGPDLALPYLLLAVLYGTWLLVRSAAGVPFRLQLARMVAGLPIAFLCLVVTGYASVTTIFRTHVQSREAQIAGSSAEQKKTPEEQEHDRWIFATNWSLPPEEAIEFLAPCMMGTRTGDSDAPYWGRLGQTHGWASHRQGFPNFRQHAIYLGAIPLLLAAFALAARRSGAPRAPSLMPSAQGEWLADAPFWAGVVAVALLLSFGRHAPFYRAFYSLPYMSLLRAPVKFVRFTELGVAMLAASGLAAASSGVGALAGCRFRRWVLAAAVLSALCVLGSILIYSQPDSLLLRAPTVPAGAAGQLRAHASRSLFHAGVCFAVLAGFFHMVRVRPARNRQWAWMLALSVAVDLCVVNRRFVDVLDIAPWYRNNSFTDHVVRTSPHGPVIANHVTPLSTRDWFTGSILMRGIQDCFANLQPQEDLETFMKALDNDVVRFWEVSGASFCIIPSAWSSRVPRDRCQHVKWLSIGNGRVREVAAPEASSVEMLRITHALPYASSSSKWRAVATSAIPQALQGAGAANEDAVIASQGPSASHTVSRAPRVGLRSSRLRDGSLSVRCDVESDSQHVLTVREPYSAGLLAFVDGQQVATFESGRKWTGLYVPAGRHHVVLHAERRLLWPLLSGAFALACGVWGGAGLLRHVRTAPGEDRRTRSGNP